MSASEKAVQGGGSNAEWQERKLAAMARGQGNATNVYVERGRNAELWDVEGRRYIDFGTGIAVCNTGHSHPKVVAAVQDQLNRFSHTCVMVTPYESAVRLAEQLNQLAPGNSEKAESSRPQPRPSRTRSRSRGPIREGAVPSRLMEASTAARCSPWA